MKEARTDEHGGATLRTYAYTSEDDIRLSLYVLSTPGAKKPDGGMNVEVLGEADWANFTAAPRPVFARALPNEMPAPAKSPADADGRNANAGDAAAPKRGTPPRRTGRPPAATRSCRRSSRSAAPRRSSSPAASARPRSPPT